MASAATRPGSISSLAISAATPSSNSPALNDRITKGLQDKLYEKRKGAALDVEKLVREAQTNKDDSRIYNIIQSLVNDFTYNFQMPNARNGGLIGLAGAAIALGPDLVSYLADIMPPVLACFNDQDNRVRYYACESMYNIAKVARGDILRYFNELFDILSKLAADSEPSVKTGAELLDRLLKDIVSEQSNYASGALNGEDSVDAANTDALTVINSDNPLDMTTVPPVMPRTFTFSLTQFIPLLRERIQTLNPFTRTFLVLWIQLLDSIPELELIAFLPEFLDGLFSYLSDPNPDVRTLTLNILGEFLKEIKRVEDLHKRKSKAPTLKGIQDREKGQEQNKLSVTSPGTMVKPQPSQDVGKLRNSAMSLSKANTDLRYRRESDDEFVERKLLEGDSYIEREGEQDGDHEQEESDGSFGSKGYEPGQGVTLHYSRMVEILSPHLTSSGNEGAAVSFQE
ncbi:hypothetical protein HDU93_008310 [Gonapodya sp. JEL0774]|nr:hypothetical protein HDU93_008310 [Gonapodya sp. JEL0774]